MALNIEVKISDTGYLCVRDMRNRWIPVFQVTAAQLREWNDTIKLYATVEKTVKPTARKHK